MITLLDFSITLLIGWDKGDFGILRTNPLSLFYSDNLSKNDFH